MKHPLLSRGNGAVDDLDRRIVALGGTAAVSEMPLLESGVRCEASGPFHCASTPREAGHGNDVWRAWKAIRPASHPSHTLWKSLWDSHIPTASTTGLYVQNQKQRQKQEPKTQAPSTARDL
jgi:hypothetical protein